MTQQELAAIMAKHGPYPERHAYWGHWGITLWRRLDTSQTYLPGVRVETISFPVGARGPVDAMRGQREYYRAVIGAWVDRGDLLV